MTRRYPGSLIASTFTPASTRRSGMWTVPELGEMITDSRWYPTNPALSATTQTTVDASTYSFANQAIGDANPHKTVFVLAGASTMATSAHAISSITIGGSAATLVSSFGDGMSMAIFAANIESATTTATIEVNGPAGANFPRMGIHVYWSLGVNKIGAISTTGSTFPVTSSAESLSVDIPPGAFVLTWFHGNLAGSTFAFTAGSTLVARTSQAAEGGYFASGVTDWSTALRLGHVISTTHTTGGPLGYTAAVIR